MIKLAVKTKVQVRDVMERIYSRLRLQTLGLGQYRAKVYFEIGQDGYSLRMARDFQDIEILTRFRFEQFFPDEAIKMTSSLDVDGFDRLADHLMIFHNETNRIIGTYRLLFSGFTPRFYSESEFRIHGFLEHSEGKLELGRAGVHPDFRNGAVIQLLWRGIARYARITKARWLFGCASIPTLDPYEAAAIQKALGPLGNSDIHFTPHPKYAGPEILTELVETKSIDSVRRLLPPLFRTYLAAGAKVVGPPAFDQNFGCVDFPIVLDLDQLNPTFRKKYMSSGAGGESLLSQQ